jgi:hypothetical protein
LVVSVVVVVTGLGIVVCCDVVVVLVVGVEAQADRIARAAARSGRINFFMDSMMTSSAGPVLWGVALRTTRTRSGKSR